MQLFRDNLHAFFTLVTVCIPLSGAQQIFYPALKVNQISVRANGRLNAVSTVALATPLPATRDTQGRRIAQRQVVGGQRVGVQQTQQVGGQPAGGSQLQPGRGPQLQPVTGSQQVGVPPLQQFGQPAGGAQLQPGRAPQQVGVPPLQQFGQPAGGTQLQPGRGPQLQKVGVPFGGQQRVGLGRPPSQQVGVSPFQQIGEPYRGGVSPWQQLQGQQVPPNFSEQQLQRVGGSGSPPPQQFIGQQVQRAPSAQYFPQYQQIQAQQLQQYSGQVVHQVTKQQYGWPVLSSPQIYFNSVNWHPYGWQATSWQHEGK